MRFDLTQMPERIAKLPRDHRGLPIPAIVFVDNAGKAHFTINDSRKVAWVTREKRCGICGDKLPPRRFCFVGGPKSILHRHGAFIDSPMHYECASFALRTCPYLAARSYERSIAGLTVGPKNLAGSIILVDPTMDPERPVVFGMACTTGYRRGEYYFPVKPWRFVEWWHRGAKIEDPDNVPGFTETRLECEESWR